MRYVVQLLQPGARPLGPATAAVPTVDGGVVFERFIHSAQGSGIRHWQAGRWQSIAAQHCWMPAAGCVNDGFPAATECNGAYLDAHARPVVWQTMRDQIRAWHRFNASPSNPARTVLGQGIFAEKHF